MLLVGAGLHLHTFADASFTLLAHYYSLPNGVEDMEHQGDDAFLPLLLIVGQMVMQWSRQSA